MNRIAKKIICGILAISLLLCINPSQAEAAGEVLWKAPFDKHDEWVVPVDGDGWNYVYGYMDSAMKAVDFEYENGVAKAFPTYWAIKSWMYYGVYGDPTYEYTYAEAVEVDLTNAYWEYDIDATVKYRVTLKLLKNDGSTLDLNLHTMEELNPDGNSTNQINLLAYLKKNFATSLEALGLRDGNKVKIKGMRCMLNCGANYGEVVYNKFQIVQGSAAAASYVNTDSTQGISQAMSTDKEAVNAVVQNDTPVFARVAVVTAVLAGLAAIIVEKKKKELN